MVLRTRGYSLRLSTNSTSPHYQPLLSTILHLPPSTSLRLPSLIASSFIHTPLVPTLTTQLVLHPPPASSFPPHWPLPSPTTGLFLHPPLASPVRFEIFAGLPLEEYRHVRALIIELVLHTDLSKHLDFLSNIQPLRTSRGFAGTVRQLGSRAGHSLGGGLARGALQQHHVTTRLNAARQAAEAA